MDPEKSRIEFLIKRDGLEATKKWVAQTMQTYRLAVLDRGDINKHGNVASTRAYRRKYIESYLSFKRFLNNV